MATQGFGGLLFGQGGTGLEDYLSPEQQQAIQQQGMMSAAAALLAASGKRPVGQEISIGQALGGALQAGQQGYTTAQQGAINTLLARQKLDEAQREKQLQQYLLGGGPTAPTIQAQPAIPAEPVSGVDLGGRGAAPNTMLGEGTYTAPAPVPMAPVVAPQPVGGSLFSKLTPEQRALAAFSPKTMIPEIMKEELKRDSFNILTPAQVTAMGLPADATYQQNSRTGQITPIVSAEATPTEIRLLKATGMPVTMANVMQIRRSGAVTVNMGEGQKGFENEMKLGGAFKQEPIYKEFEGMKTAFNQVTTALNQGTPISDLAGATKMMKMMDEGSVVRESELALAMAAAGRMDRLKNYLNNAMTGQRLTPTQREDFKSLSNELYAAAAQAYNKKRSEYEDFGSKYGLDASKVLGSPATIPSIIKGSGGAGGQQRKPLNSIFNPS